MSSQEEDPDDDDETTVSSRSWFVIFVVEADVVSESEGSIRVGVLS
jgi:hypothetical protein